VLNASGIPLDAGHTGFYVNPLRNQVFPNTVSYDIASKELAYFQRYTHSQLITHTASTISASYAPIPSTTTPPLLVQSTSVKVTLSSAVVCSGTNSTYHIAVAVTKDGDPSPTIDASDSSSIVSRGGSTFPLSVSNTFILTLTGINAGTLCVFSLYDKLGGNLGSTATPAYTTLIVENL